MPDSHTPAKLQPDRLWDYALKLLSQRGYSASELRVRLAARAQTASVLNEVMSKLKEYGMVDDKRFAELYATSRRENESFGKLRILRELRAKKVPQVVAERAVSKVFAAVDEQELAHQHLIRKYRGRDLAEVLHDEPQLASAFRRLRRAGFSTAASVAVLKRFSSRAAELESLPDEQEAEEAAAAGE